MLCRDHCRIQAAAIVPERGSGALHHREHGTLAQFVLATCDQCGHFHRGFGFMSAIDALGLYVFGGVLPNCFDLVQPPRFHGRILRGDRDPVERDLFRGIRHAGDILNIAQA